jgi:hypothetical protein
MEAVASTEAAASMEVEVATTEVEVASTEVEVASTEAAASMEAAASTEVEVATKVAAVVTVATAVCGHGGGNRFKLDFNPENDSRRKWFYNILVKFKGRETTVLNLAPLKPNIL